MGTVRWDGQRLDDGDGTLLPGMPSARGLLRSVEVPEFPGVTLHEVLARSALNKVPDGSRVPFSYTINPYRGCLHACLYCYARSTHEYLDLDAGRDFDTQIVVKTNLVEVLRRELAKPSWRRENVALGTNTDPYQRAEGRYRLMPGVIRALADSGTPFSVLTKGNLARRDVPLLASAAQEVPVGFGVSLAIWDEELHASLESGVPSPRARLDLVRAVTDAGLPCGVFLAPVLPGLTDRLADLDTALEAIAAAGATGVTVVPLHLRPGAREWFSAWLAREHPSLVGRYRQLYRGGAYVTAEYRSWLAARVTPLLHRHGLDAQRGGGARGVDGEAPAGVPGDDQAAFPAGSLPPAGSAPVPAAAPRRGRARAAREEAAPDQLVLL
ncbi:DNA repair photolyase [Geodermatophilus dictyosporus]|uniref:DNA repair photolyase n=1 Tax=Geodermatophilus dictyosporus TaxID=1523247 RepID=A0A1I5JWJ9_9ACTN|nr:Rv2578c family radical SAM protein [Geodermatophilus dictyosporus]SFO76736.1 DNA repair photolyase [Geodermatophilus dictyosporus]